MRRILNRLPSLLLAIKAPHLTTVRLLGRHIQDSDHTIDRNVERDGRLGHTESLCAGVATFRLGEAVETQEELAKNNMIERGKRNRYVPRFLDPNRNLLFLDVDALGQPVNSSLRGRIGGVGDRVLVLMSQAS